MSKEILADFWMRLVFQLRRAGDYARPATASSAGDQARIAGNA